MTSAAKVYRFSVFELDVCTGEFRKKRVKIRLQQQPLQVLIALLERPGELVTRDELKRRLWPSDTFVDFNHSLNAAVNRLREVLDDSANTPRFVETLPRRGYRFIAPVASDGPALPAPARPDDSMAIESPVASTTPSVYGRRVWYLSAAALLLLAALGAKFGPNFVGASAHVGVRSLAAEPLTTFEGAERGPSFSPDGTQVAFSWDGENEDNYDIYVQVIGAPTALRLTDDPAPETRPAWSPDGRRIAFIRSSLPAPSVYISIGQSIYVISALGGPKRKVADFSNLDTNSLAWWPDSKSLVIADRDSPEGKIGLYRLFVDTGVKQPLTRPLEPTEAHRFPAVSPDGRHLAFTRSISGTNEIRVVPLEGGEARSLVFDTGAIYGLAWTADSSRIVFSRALVDGQWPALWQVSPRGGEPRELSSLGLRVYRPSISRQGGGLAFERGLVDSNVWSYELPAGNKPPAVQKLIFSTEIDACPQISPDSERIVFASTRTGNCEIWICDRDGSHQQQLTFFAQAHAGSPRWSPDGRQIAFDSSPGGNRDIFVVSAEGGPPRRMTEEAGDDSRPSWSHDRKWIYFNSDRSGAFEIWKVPGEGGQAVQVTRGGGYQPFEDPDGRYLYFAKGRQENGVWRAPLGAGQIGQEELVLPELPLAGFTGQWDIARDGIFFVHCEKRSERGGGCVLRLLRLQTRQIEEVMNLKEPPFAQSPLDVTPDGKSLVYAQHDRRGSDLMLVEDFQ